MARTLRMSGGLRQAMLAHVASTIPEEGCGLLAGKNSTDSAEDIEVVLPITNQLHSKIRFYMDPIEQLRAFEWMDAQKLDLLGIYHSHPAGPATPSPTDLAEFTYPGVAYLICSPDSQGWQVRAFEITEGHSREITLEVSG